MTAQTAWTPADGMMLEPNALTAATAVTGNVAVVAGPGSGKTELLAQRADFLLRTGECPYPRRVLALSFKVDAARNLGERVRKRLPIHLATRMDSRTFHAFAAGIVKAFRPSLRGHSALPEDYVLAPAPSPKAPNEVPLASLVPLALEILQSNAYARNGLRQTYSHVLLDEFQDSSAAQHELIDVLFRGTSTPITAVGDSRQKIMTFAGALEDGFGEFIETFDADELRLHANFRAAPTLRRLQHRIALQMQPDVEEVEVETTYQSDEGTIQVCQYATDGQEAADIVKRIAHWLHRGTAPSQIAVLMRQKVDMVGAPLAAELTKRGIPFRNDRAHQDLISEPGAALVLDFLRVISGSSDPNAYQRLKSLAIPGYLSDEESQILESQLHALLETAEATATSRNFPRTDSSSWADLLQELVDLLKKRNLVGLSSSYGDGGRLKEIVNEAFRAFQSALAETKDPVLALKRLAEPEAVRLLTVHKAKGLEFEKVVVLGVENELFWGDQQLAEFFVAVSRAKDTLVLTHCEHRARPVSHTASWRERRSPHATLLGLVGEGANAL